MPPKRVTLKDIAQACNLAVSTVSNILNDNKDSFASAKVKALVKQTAEEMGYRKNFLSLSLRTQRTFSIGLCIDRVANETRRYFINSFVKCFNDKGYEVALYSHEASSEKALEAIDFFDHRYKDGIVLFSDFAEMKPDFPDRFKKRIKESRCPVLSVGQMLRGLTPSMDIERAWALSDGLKRLREQKGEEKGVQKEEQKSEEYGEDDKILAVYKGDFELREALHEFQAEDILAHNDVRNLDDFQRVWQNLEASGQRVKKIFFRTDEVAVPALQWLQQEKGLLATRDFVALSYDNYSTSEFSIPPLSSYDLCMSELGEKCFDLLIRWIEKDETPPHDTYDSVKPRFIERSTLR
jgi:DNA-binding LacI/PurR family transcriptional regulator